MKLIIDVPNEDNVKKMARQIKAYCNQFEECVDCPFHLASDDMCALERPYNYQVSDV